MSETRQEGTTLIATTAAGFEGEAGRELVAAIGDGRWRPLVMKGNISVVSGVGEEEALERIAAAETSCVSRVVPVQRRVTAERDASCFEVVATAAAEIGRIGKGETFLVRCTRRGEHAWQSRELERAVASRLEQLTGGIGEYEAETDWVVCVEVYQSLGFVGVSRPARVLQKQVRKQRKHAPGERPLNRAEWKIKEALEAFGIGLEPGARVLDLGAAPGGWTGVLARMAAEVVAVDPAELDPKVAALGNVRHLRRRAEDAELRQEVSGPFQLLTCDMNVEPAEAARIVCSLADLLEPGAWAIMTVKYVTRQRSKHRAEARRGLSAVFEDIRMQRLPHNGLETTAVMRKAVASDG
ncbi:MAG: SAM-dependent methyltransferase [Armatimonadota bacterium]